MKINLHIEIEEDSIEETGITSLIFSHDKFSTIDNTLAKAPIAI